MILRQHATTALPLLAFLPALLAASGPAPSTLAPAPSASSVGSSAAPALSSADLSLEPSAPPEQVLWLRSGAVIRGRIVEYDPGRKVVLQLATGEVRSLNWSEVARASWISSPAVSSSSAPAPPRASSSPRRNAEPDSGRLLVELLPADPRLWLEERLRYASDSSWHQACQAPCNRLLDTEDRSFRISGPGVRPSNPFHVKGEGSQLKLVVSPGLQSTHAWGVRLLVSGILLAVGSGSLYGYGQYEDSTALKAAGLVGLVLGGVAVLGSLPVLGLGRTTVRNRTGERVGGSDLLVSPAGPTM